MDNGTIRNDYGGRVDVRPIWPNGVRQDAQAVLCQHMSVTRVFTSAAGANSVAWNGTVFCAVKTNLTWTSPDAITWATVAPPTLSVTWSKLLWNGSVFHALVDSSANSMTSPDGVTWTDQVLFPTAPVVWGNAYCVGGANNDTFLYISQTTGVAMTSSDGINWTTGAITARQWKGVVWAGGQFVAVAYGTTTLVYTATSPDGVTWTLGNTSSIDTRGLLDIAYGGGRYVAIGDLGLIGVSFDGVNWTFSTAPTLRYPSSYITWANGVFIATGTSVISTSPDGMTWTERHPVDMINTYRAMTITPKAYILGFNTTDFVLAKFDAMEVVIV